MRRKTFVHLPSTLPSDAVQALRALTRARRDLIESRTAARQRVPDELVVLFPELMRALPRLLPGRTDRGHPAILHLISTYSSAQALGRVSLQECTSVVHQRCAPPECGRMGNG
jgi:hypothetical protein